MTPDDFRRLALSQPKAVEVYRAGHSEFRVLRKSFASLDGPADSVATVQLTSEQQAMFMQQRQEFLSLFPGLGSARNHQCYARVRLRSDRGKRPRRGLAQHRPKVVKSTDEPKSFLSATTLTFHAVGLAFSHARTRPYPQNRERYRTHAAESSREGRP
jgi:hypothetical protein